MFYERPPQKNFVKFTGNLLFLSLLFDEVAGIWNVTLVRRDSGTGAFLQSLTKFSRMTRLQNTSG